MGRNKVQILICFITLIVVTASRKDQTRWSRQISSYTADISDWVPLTGPIEKQPEVSQGKKQAVAEPRILSEPFPALSRSNGFTQETIPTSNFYNSPANRQLYLQSVPSAPQNHLTEQGFVQGIRFGLSPDNFPLTQGFVAPQFDFENPATGNTRQQPISTNPVKFETVPQPLSLAQMRFPSQTSNINPKPAIVERFVDGYRAENTSNINFNTKNKPQTLQNTKFLNNEKSNIDPSLQKNPQSEREEVQLLYVPLESLNRGQFNFRHPIGPPQLVNTDLYTQGLPMPNPLKQTLTDFQKPVVQPLNNFANQDYYSNFNFQLAGFDQIPKFSTIATPFSTHLPSTPRPMPKKLKPHQPPLAIFLTQESVKSSQMKVSDVLSSLKTASTIAVLDSVNPLNAPKVFIGPSTLKAPANFVKFELPYLSNIENSDKKLKQLPFFVAPLSYNTPQGFAKIPFPSPHVGSVVINSQIKESPTTQTTLSSLQPQNYQTLQQHHQPQKYFTQRPAASFYSIASPKTIAPPNYQSNYYSFEPQTVSSFKPPKEPEITTAPSKTNNYFLNNAVPQYNPQFVRFPENDIKTPEIMKYSIPAQTETPITTPKIITTTPSPTTKQPSTYPSQLLETHNPYSINQAFQFSTPLDYHNYFEDDKEPKATPKIADFRPSPTLSPVDTTPTSRVEDLITERPIKQQTSPSYLQNYSPEIHYDDDNLRYPDFKQYEYSTRSKVSEVTETIKTKSTLNPSQYIEHIETLPPQSQETNNSTAPDVESPSTYEYNQYETSYNQDESTTTSTTTIRTTSRRIPTRQRSRPRYTTARTESTESTYRPTHRPLRERRPLPNRSRYEPNKITTEKPTRSSYESSTETTSKPIRTRIRGRVHYKPSDTEEIYDRRIKHKNSKEDDLAYQRDVLHQNYPVTLTERRSTIDIEAITEPTIKSTLSQNLDPTTEAYDTDNAYTNEKLSYAQQINDAEENDDIYITKHTSRAPIQTESTYVPKFPFTSNDEYTTQSKKVPPANSLSYDISSTNKEENYSKDTTEVENVEKEEAYVTESVNTIHEEIAPIYSINNELSPVNQEHITASIDTEVTKSSPQEIVTETEEEEEIIVQTTPSYNRVRIRPGVVRQYHQSSTESTRVKPERKRPSVTYRPAFDRRRTTMRIEEIEADLKTKQVRARPEVQDYKHPIYKPEASTEPNAPLSTQETTTKRGSLRRRRPNYTYTTTSSDITATRRPYEAKIRFRGRRPTEKPIEKSEPPTEATTTTTRNPPYTKYSHRPRLSERYNKNSQPEEIEDQDTNYSINRPNYAEPERDVWSPKISSDSFKPYNRNNIVDDRKSATTDEKLDNAPDSDIITARNEFDDMLIAVTPVSNNMNSKKIPEIPPTLEALVEQSKITKSGSPESSNFESILEEVMKSLEEQDEDEYTKNVMKHKGGEIGEIPPEIIISSVDAYSQKQTTKLPEEETTMVETTAFGSDVISKEEKDRKNHRRGFWKKVKVRPVTTESFEVAESQYYTSTVNRLGEPVRKSKLTHEKPRKSDNKIAATTYKPKYEFIKDLFENEDESLDVVATVDIPKIKTEDTKQPIQEDKSTTVLESESTEKHPISPGDLDLGTGSPDPTIDETYFTTPMELTTNRITTIEKSDSFSFIDYLFGPTSEGSENHTKKNYTIPKIFDFESAALVDNQSQTTESSYIPEEITTQNADTTTYIDSKRNHNSTKLIKDEEKIESLVTKVETSSVSSFMNPTNVVSTSMSTQVSHETEICFRGKCIKTMKNVNF